MRRPPKERLRHPRRRHRPRLPAPRERDRAVPLRLRHRARWPTSGCTTASCRSKARKMSKSEGNFVTINELLNTEKFGGRKWPGEVLRLAMLMTHYREPIDFSGGSLEEAETALRAGSEAAARACAGRDARTASSPRSIDTATPTHRSTWRLGAHEAIQARLRKPSTRILPASLAAVLRREPDSASTCHRAPVEPGSIDDVAQIRSAANASLSSPRRTGPRPTRSATSCWRRASS